jgi:hypothetical protein
MERAWFSDMRLNAQLQKRFEVPDGKVNLAKIRGMHAWVVSNMADLLKSFKDDFRSQLRQEWDALVAPQLDFDDQPEGADNQFYIRNPLDRHDRDRQRGLHSRCYNRHFAQEIAAMMQIQLQDGMRVHAGGGGKAVTVPGEGYICTGCGAQSFSDTPSDEGQERQEQEDEEAREREREEYRRREWEQEGE